jgi:predicted anti-sigma-YlaC factor YlaD
MDIDLIKRIVCEIITTHIDEITCEECFKHIERFAELTLTGGDAHMVLPLVHDHLQHCADCREEFDALCSALNSRPSQRHP